MFNIFQISSRPDVVYVEDFIEVLAQGHEHDGSTKMIKLASYDVSIVQSMYNQTAWQSLALTDRQAQLAVRLIEKYTRQFKSMGIDNSGVLDPATRQYRMPIRKVDRDCSVYRADDMIMVRFPYMSTLINYIKENKNNLEGSCSWDPTARAWKFALTESNLSFVVALAQHGPFLVDEALLSLFEDIGQTESLGYGIQLVEDQLGLHITNAAPALIDYVNTHLGGFDTDNLLTLVDNSAELGYTVSQPILDRIGAQYGSNLVRMLLGHRINLDPADVPFDDFYRYAVEANRFPILIYNPSPDERARQQIFGSSIITEQQIFSSGRRSHGRGRFDPDRHRVYFTSVLERGNHFPASLKISYHNMTYGANRLRWLNSPGKIIYYCTELKSRG